MYKVKSLFFPACVPHLQTEVEADAGRDAHLHIAAAGLDQIAWNPSRWSTETLSSLSRFVSIADDANSQREQHSGPKCIVDRPGVSLSPTAGLADNELRSGSPVRTYRPATPSDRIEAHASTLHLSCVQPTHRQRIHPEFLHTFCVCTFRCSSRVT